jgi:heptosyltransferase-2
MNIGVMLPNWIGDVAMATPTLRALAEHYGPSSTITGILRPYVAEVLSGTSWLDELVFYDHRSTDSQVRTWNVVKEMRRRKFDLLLVLTNSWRTGLVAWLSAAKERVGYARYGRRWLLSRPLHPPRESGRLAPISAVDYYLHLAREIGCPAASPRLELATTPSEEDAADRVWRNLKLASCERVVILNTGSAAGSAKCWPAEHFARLARRIAERGDAGVLVVCGPAERGAAVKIVENAAHPRVASLSDYPLGIGLTKACIRRGDLVVTTDSGPRHFAAAFNVPAVSLFGPTDPRWAHNYHSREIQLRVELPCSPCAKKICPLGHHGCMRELTVDRVYKAVEKQLAACATQAA